MDLRKAPSRAQKAAIKKFADVIAGRAAVVSPKNPKSYRERYRVKGNKVVIPRGKGERITTDKAGTIRISGKSPRGRKYKAKIQSIETAPAAGEIYYAPLGANGQMQRIGDAADLQRFKIRYPRFAKHPEYIVAMDIDEDNEDDDERLENQLMKQIRRKRRERAAKKKSRKRGRKRGRK